MSNAKREARMRQFVALLSTLFCVLLLSCEQPSVFDKNTMKGSWQFVSATDGKSYGDIEIISVGSNEYSPYENSWKNPNPWYVVVGYDVIMNAGESFAIKTQDNDLKNIEINPSPAYIGLVKTLELDECSPSMGGIMVFSNVSDGVTYSYRRTGL
jgi:hypothetical protein